MELSLEYGLFSRVSLPIEQNSEGSNNSVTLVLVVLAVEDSLCILRSPIIFFELPLDLSQKVLMYL